MRNTQRPMSRTSPKGQTGKAKLSENGIGEAPGFGFRILLEARKRSRAARAVTRARDRQARRPGRNQIKGGICRTRAFGRKRRDDVALCVSCARPPGLFRGDVHARAVLTRSRDWCPEVTA